MQEEERERVKECKYCRNCRADRGSDRRCKYFAEVFSG